MMSVLAKGSLQLRQKQAAVLLRNSARVSVRGDPWGAGLSALEGLYTIHSLVTTFLTNKSAFLCPR